jgi:hypothetical protein
MYNYIYKHQLIDKYFDGYSNFNTNNFNPTEGVNSFSRFKNVEDFTLCNNTDEYMCDYKMDESYENGTYGASTNFFSKNK